MKLSESTMCLQEILLVRRSGALPNALAILMIVPIYYRRFMTEPSGPSNQEVAE